MSTCQVTWSAKRIRVYFTVNSGKCWFTFDLLLINKSEEIEFSNKPILRQDTSGEWEKNKKLVISIWNVHCRLKCEGEKVL